MVSFLMGSLWQVMEPVYLLEGENLNLLLVDLFCTRTFKFIFICLILVALNLANMLKQL